MSWKFNLALLGLFFVLPQVIDAKQPTVTNWRVQLSTEFNKPPILDSLIESHEASSKLAGDKVDALWSRIKEVLAEKVPASFFTNPPWAGEIAVKTVLKQKVSMQSPSSKVALRATDVSHSLLERNQVPGDEIEAQRKKEAEFLQGKAKEYEFVGLRIILKDAAGKERFNTWYPAEQNGKIKVKKITPEVVVAMRMIAAHPDTPVFNERH